MKRFRLDDRVGGTYNAARLAKGWLSVALASGKFADLPPLYRTVALEHYETGVRLIATDQFVMLHSWVPSVNCDDAPAPALSEGPIRTAIARDVDGRAKGLLAYMLKLAAELAKADSLEDPPEIRLYLDVTEVEPSAPTLDGFEQRYVVLEVPDSERLQLPTYEGDFPEWRRLTSSFAGEETDVIALNPEILGRLGKLGKLHGGTPLLWSFGGQQKMARLEVADSNPDVRGVVMPCRWDFDRDQPYKSATDEDGGN